VAIVLILTQNLLGQRQSPECGSAAEGSFPGIETNSKLMIIAAKNINNESNAIASPKQTLGPI